MNGFIFARIGLGIGEAGNFPAGVKAIAEWFPKQERGLATGIFNAGTSVGVVMAVFLVPAILHIGSWKEVFWITGGLGFIWLIFWIFFYNTPEKSKYLTKDEYNFIKAGQGLVPAEQSTEKLNLFKFFHHKQTWA